MSRVGMQPVAIPGGVTVTVDGPVVTAKGQKGELSITVSEGIAVTIEGAEAVVTRADDDRKLRSLHGLTRSLIANMVEGVEKGFRRELEIEGVGFRGAIQGNTLSLSLGFASPKEYTIPDGVSVTEQGGTKLVVEGADKQLVGTVAARIRSYYPAEPYKGKGVKYAGEQIRRKVGKTVA